MSLKEQLDYLDSKVIDSPIDSLENAAEMVRFPTSYEPSLTHPDHHSTVKLRDNGIIDIFAASHQGIRIDPNEQVINVCTNKLYQHLGRLRSWITHDAKIEVAEGCHLVNHAYITVDCKGDIVVNTNGNVTVNASGNVNVNAKGNISLKAQGKIDITSGAHIQFTAPRYDFA